MKNTYTKDELTFAQAYAKHHNYVIKQDYEDYTEFKRVCTLIKADHGLKSWSECNSFLRPPADLKSLISKYE